MQGESTSTYRKLVKTQLSRPDVKLKIRDALASVDHKENVSYHGNSGVGNHGHGNDPTHDPSQAMSLLRSQGIIDSLLSDLLAKTTTQGHNHTRGSASARSQHHHHQGVVEDSVAATNQPLAGSDEDGCYLMVELVQGRAFIEHLLDGAEGTDASPDHSPSHRRQQQRNRGSRSATLHFHIAFRQQNFASKPVPCASEPNIHESFPIRLASEQADQVSLSSLLATRDPIYVTVVKRDSANGESRLISSTTLEWRIVLCSDGGRTAINLELLGIGPEAKMSTGVLEVRLQLLPHPGQILDDDVVSSQISLERARVAERDRVFFVYAKQWWREYLQIRESHSHRPVKIFAHDENGVTRFVCCYVRPLRAGRLLESPRQCARFVCSVPFERSSGLGTGPKEQWTTGRAFLARNRGDTEDHAVLLCSLLLGFGLDAYVVIGTKGRANQQHAWVVTVQDANGDEAVFWDAVKGKRYSHRALHPERFPEELPGKAPSHPFRTIACIFNHSRFFANNQPSDDVETCVFNVQDEARWKAMSEDAIAAINSSTSPSIVVPPCLTPVASDPIALSNDLEHQLRQLVCEVRRERCDLSTHWDATLSYLLTQALAAYELEQVTGVSSGNEEFQGVIRRHVPDGHTFKGYPIQVLHTNGRQALNSALKSTICQEIVHCRGDLVRLAVRVRVFAYAELATVTWIMFACTYKSVP